MSKIREATKVIAAIRRELRQVQKHGLGREVLSGAEEQALDDLVDTWATEVLAVYARVRIAHVLGVAHIMLSGLQQDDSDDEDGEE
jgi:hypothetical protein